MTDLYYNMASENELPTSKKHENKTKYIYIPQHISVKKIPFHEIL